MSAMVYRSCCVLLALCLPLSPACEANQCPEGELADVLEEELKVSLLQTQTRLRPSSREGAAPPLDQVYNLHIPKSAGSSFALDAQRILQATGVSVISQEGCYGLHKDNPHLKGTVTMLRSPRAHVLSQFGMCHTRWVKEYRFATHLPGRALLPKSFEEWVRKWSRLNARGFHGDFTPAPDPVTGASMENIIRGLRATAWGEPPYSVQQGTKLHLSDWPTLDGGGTIWHFTQVPFQCYVPVNLQSHRMTCQKPLQYGSPDIDLAVLLRNLEGLWFVGFAEAYQASICLLHSKVSLSLPSYCNCTDPQSWQSFHGHKENQNSTHIGPKAIPADVLADLDLLTATDTMLYKAAWIRFVQEAADVEEKFGMRILCNTALPLAVASATSSD